MAARVSLLATAGPAGKNGGGGSDGAFTSSAGGGGAAGSSSSAELQLVQGPPGTGKTSTTAALLSVLAGVARPGTALLACAPTNAAVGEIAARCVSCLLLLVIIGATCVCTTTAVNTRARMLIHAVCAIDVRHAMD